MSNEAFDRLYSAYAGEIYAWLYARVGLDRQAAEDLTQECFIAAYSGLGGFRGLSSQRTWMYGIARNKLNDYYRERYRIAARTADMPEDEPDAAEPLDVMLDRQADNAAFERAMSAIAERYRLVLALKYAQGKSVSDIARLSGGSVKSAEGMLARARRAFAAQYARYMKGEATNER